MIPVEVVQGALVWIWVFFLDGVFPVRGFSCDIAGGREKIGDPVLLLHDGERSSASTLPKQ